MKKEVKSFQAETKQLLDLMIHSIYIHKEIFLRELISNASDAIDKLKFKSLTQPEILDKNEEFEIFIKVDENERTISVTDNGIGMTYDDVVQNIGTIAQSGSKAFIKNIQNSENTANLELIGQFGVGFYSVFMVADEVTILTKNYASDKGVKWISKGDGTYEIEETEKTKRGTEIILKLKEKEENDETWQDFLNEYTLQNIIKKYSNFIRFSIKMEIEKTEYPKDENGNPDYEKEPIKHKEIEVINATKPLWLRDKKEIKEEEYNDFYKQEFHDFFDLLSTIHTKAEGTLEYTSLLFIPKKAPFDFYSQSFKKGIKLYSKNVFIMDKCEEILPEYFKFVKGLVDSSEFSLNVSREVLQHNTVIKVVSKNLEKKIIEELKYILENDREKYTEFFKEFGKILKQGIYSDYTAKEKLQDLLVFESSDTTKSMTTLNEYVLRMKEGQDKIYYAVGKNKETIEKLPQMEILKDKGFEVLYFIDKIDEFITQNLSEYKEKKLQSISKSDFSVDKEKDAEVKTKQEENKDLLTVIKEALKEKITDVKLSNKLKSSAVCIVSGDKGISINMEKVLKDYESFSQKADKILEINPNHRIFEVMKKIHTESPSSEKLKTYSELLYNQALIIEGLPVEDPIAFSNSICDLMTEKI